MKKNNLTEEELAALKEELKVELKKEMELEKTKKGSKKTTTKKVSTKTTTTPKTTTKKSNQTVTKPKTTTVKKSEVVVEEVNKTVNKEVLKKEVPMNKADTKFVMAEETKSSPMLLIVITLLLVGAIFFLPKLYDVLKSDVKQDKIVDKKEEKPEEVEVIEYKWEDKIVKELTYPIMRNNVHSKDSYYQVDKITMSDFSNNDILYNAFLNVYSGNIATYTEGYAGTYCGSEETKKTFNAKYIDARIKNLYTKNTEYTHTDFVVPDTADTIYKGLWKYDAALNRYIYYGKCSIVEYTAQMYFDILIPKTISNNEAGDTINLEYSIAFVKFDNGNYEIYSDPNYENIVLNGVLENNDQSVLEEKVKDNLDEFNTYKYTFSTIDCAYEDFCFVSGEFVK